MEARSKNLPGLAIAVLICFGVILLGIYPYRPNNLLGWVVLLLLSIPVVAIYELIGTKLHENRELNSVGKVARIVFGVIVSGLIIIASMSAVSTLEPHLGKWGA